VQAGTFNEQISVKDGKAGIGLDNDEDMLVKCNDLYENTKAGLGIVSSITLSGLTWLFSVPSPALSSSGTP
jgi:hypothetical protein